MLEEEGRRVVSVVWYEGDVAERKGSWLICEDEIERARCLVA